MRPEVPAAPLPTARLLGALLAMSLLVLALVNERELQMVITGPIVMAGAVVLLVLRRQRAKELGIESSSDLPKLPLAPRLLLMAVSVGGLVVLIATGSVSSAWSGVLLVTLFAVDDVIRRWAWREVLEGGQKARRQPLPLWSYPPMWPLTFVIQGGLFGALSLTGNGYPLTVENVWARGWLFGALMTAFLAVVGIRDRRRSLRSLEAEKTGCAPDGSRRL